MNSELNAVVEYMERERGVDRETIIEAIESALQNAANKSMADAEDLRVVISRETLDIKAFARKKVVMAVNDRYNEVSLAEARRTNPANRRIAVYRYGPSWGHFRLPYRPSQELLARLTPRRRGLVYPHGDAVLPPGRAA